MATAQKPDLSMEETLTRMVGEWQLPLLRTCCAVLGSEDLAKDAVQETFLKADRGLPSFRGECSEKTWLMRIAVNVCRDMLRSSWFRAIDRRVSLEQLPEPVSHPVEEDQFLMESILTLPLKQREVVLLYYYHNMTLKEIAGALNISQPSVSRRMSCAKKTAQESAKGGSTVKKSFHQSVQRAMDSCFSGVQADPFLAQKIINDKEEKPVKRKLTLATVLVTLLIMLAVTALAMGVYEAIKPAMDQSAPLLLGEDWGLDNKLRFVEVLRAYGIVANDDEQLALCVDPSVSDDRREEAASILIDRIYGDLMREQLDPTILQPEEYNTPGLETVFTVFYRSVSPDADQAVISAEFKKWFAESDLFEPAGEAGTYQRSEKAAEEYVRQLCLSELSEIHSFSKKERQATEITIRFDDEAGLWIADFFVEAEQLRPALRAEWGESYFDLAQNAYHWTKLFLASGERTDASSVEEYEWSQLIPRAAYPHWEDWESDLRAFLYCSTEERAEFCAAYKPVVDAFLDQRPDIKQYFLDTQSGYANRYSQTIYDITRQTYGIPDEGSIPEEEALRIAQAAYLNSGLEGVTQEMLQKRCLTSALFIVTEPSKPIWKVRIAASPHSGAWSMEDHHNGYRVVIDAASGAILEEGELYGSTPGMTVLESALWHY